MEFSLSQYNIHVKKLLRNISAPDLYEHAICKEEGTALADNGALMVYSGEKTGRSPKQRKILKNSPSEKNIDWGKINIPTDQESYHANKAQAIGYINQQDQLYIVDAYAGWEPKYQLKVRIICTRPYHALFMENMLVMPEKIEDFGEPDYVIFNAGQCKATTSIDINLEQKEVVILGTEYAGEMKKGIFSIMNYLMPLKDVFPMHCSATTGKDNNVSVLFGLSGTGKTTLSADPNRKLIGDDEHCWHDQGIFNIEGGCYAKVIGLSAEREPDIYKAIRYGTVLENVVYDNKSRSVDYSDSTITENTRASYPIQFIQNAQIPCVSGHPNNIIFLTCDAFGVLPPVSSLSPEQAAYHFISGYSAKIAGTEVGISEPKATFSACFGAPFMLWHPNKYAELLSSKIKKHNAKVWLVNTGWTGGDYGTGSRIKLKYTRAIIDGIHNNCFAGSDSVTDPDFGLQIPLSCPNIPADILIPENTWKDKSRYFKTKKKLINLFIENFKQYEAGVSKEIANSGPKLAEQGIFQKA
ncbi:phosphoenolpyruvate carboxykinase (ATP) [Cytophagaceae bacterium ABcell3]|nr:phosphoenolpyruvate carboxykinase (ATP) [Cytophagaceae bacterium ABcell3]